VSRIDYYRDPAAPPANSLVPAASAVVTDEVGRIVLQRRVDNGLWALPGGGMEIGESISDTVVREVREETGLQVDCHYVIGVYSDPWHVFAYTDGEVRQEFSVCVAATATGNGDLRVSSESHEVAWYTADQITELAIHPRIRLRIDDYLAGIRAVLR
jgi:ADP-ribose pyrophosphatase YjhB (NUDIX family)